MQCFYLIALTFAFGLISRYLWKVEQVLSVAALLSGIITFFWAFTIAPAWGQLVMTTFLFALYRLPGWALLAYSERRVSIK